jgi:arsenite methyltransferase
MPAPSRCCRTGSASASLPICIDRVGRRSALLRRPVAGGEHRAQGLLTWLDFPLGQAVAAGLTNVEPLEGEMEAIPLPDASVDLIISNGVINLSARKARVMAECARVLRPGGWLCVSDLTVEQDDLPPEIATEPAAWAGCVAGALAEDAFVYKLGKAGFTDINVVHREPLSVDDCALYPLFTDEVIELMRALIPAAKQPAVAVAVVVTARPPTAARRDAPSAGLR